MEITTIKLYKSTKSALDSFRQKNESYDEIITKMAADLKKKNLDKELIEGYKNMGKEDLKLLKEWDITSKEVDY
ncbi:MAG TPA: hypothetical protein VJC07_03240 [Candidatus Nanoarchaeia archaeon]|nr:hypothetical protein [Candidatus Nanoarchaeia archaeon]